MYSSYLLSYCNLASRACSFLATSKPSPYVIAPISRKTPVETRSAASFEAHRANANALRQSAAQTNCRVQH
eukprot:scaffold215501_cov28-Tisochrysis_lutea.AAC.1